MSETKMMELLQNLQILEDEKKELEKRIASVKDEILPQLEDVETIENSVFLVRYTLCERVSLDTKKLEKEDIETFNKYKKATLYRRFSYQFK